MRSERLDKSYLEQVDLDRLRLRNMGERAKLKWTDFLPLPLAGVDYKERNDKFTRGKLEDLFFFEDSAEQAQPIRKRMELSKNILEATNYVYIAGFIGTAYYLLVTHIKP